MSQGYKRRLYKPWLSRHIVPYWELFTTYYESGVYVNRVGYAASSKRLWIFTIIELF